MASKPYRPKSTSDYEITIFDWPDRFFIETDEPDRDIIEIFGDYTPYPHLIDLGDLVCGRCDCRGFRFHVLPNYRDDTLVNEKGQLTCGHIDACIKFRDKFNSEKPKQLPTQITWD